MNTFFCKIGEKLAGKIDAIPNAFLSGDATKSNRGIPSEIIQFLKMKSPSCSRNYLKFSHIQIYTELCQFPNFFYSIVFHSKVIAIQTFVRFLVI